MINNPIYCPVCGNHLVEQEIGGRPRPACDNCGYVHYVNPVPGVGMLIEMEGGIVLIQRGNPPHKGEWTLPSGFVEADESAEEAAIREAKEETGLTVEIVEMMGINSFPEGPPVSGIMIFFRMRSLAGEPQAGDDASDVRVFQPEELPRLPFRTHREIISEWIARFHQGVVSSQDFQTNTVEDQMVIRLATPKDMDEVLALLAMIPPNRTLGAEDWHIIGRRLVEDTTIEVFVAEIQQKPPIIVGFVALSVVRTLTEGIGFINDMAVLPTYQRRGVGAALLEAVLNRAEGLNLGTLLVNTKRGNEQARAFYAAVGLSPATLMQLRHK